MKQKIFFIALLIAMPLQYIGAKTVFTIEGPERSYNQIRVTNETSHDTIRCRLVVLKDDNSTDWVYGVYNINGRNEQDSNTNSIHRGTRIGIELPKNFEPELSYALEYLDLPLFDIVIVHLYDKDSEFNEE